MRKTNKSEMTITEQFEVIKEKLCSGYCRYPDVARATVKDPDGAQEWLQDNFCNNCPLCEL